MTWWANHVVGNACVVVTAGAQSPYTAINGSLNSLIWFDTGSQPPNGVVYTTDNFDSPSQMFHFNRPAAAVNGSSHNILYWNGSGALAKDFGSEAACLTALRTGFTVDRLSWGIQSGSFDSSWDSFTSIWPGVEVDGVPPGPPVDAIGSSGNPAKGWWPFMLERRRLTDTIRRILYPDPRPIPCFA